MLKLLVIALLLAAPLLAEEKASAKSAVAATQNVKSGNSRDEMLDEMEMLDGVTLMEVDETGDRRWVLEGSSAKQSEGVKIRFFDVIVTLFRKDGSVVKLLTEYADVNRETGEIETDKTVQLLDGDRLIKGRGLYVIYSKEKKECKLFHDVEIKAKIEKNSIDVFKAGK
ncbi:LPS export ABC transporter periplasmic protein LptC [bacterium]|nr:LPS export ABC transporter periplasmic protein LptC [bacterium]